MKSAEAQIRSSEAALTQAKARAEQLRKSTSDHTVIKAPIDGIVISRSVDQGQTVAASMNAPTLYVIAADLTKMQVLANIDEADVGRMRPGQARDVPGGCLPDRDLHRAVVIRCASSRRSCRTSSPTRP